MLSSRKSEAGLVIVLVIIIVALFVGWLISYNSRECRSNRDCGSESYCGSDFACHQYPNIQKTVAEYNFILPSLILGIAIIIFALIFNWEKISPKQKPHEPEHIEEHTHSINGTPQIEEATEPYYKSDSNIRMP